MKNETFVFDIRSLETRTDQEEADLLQLFLDDYGVEKREQAKAPHFHGVEVVIPSIFHDFEDGDEEDVPDEFFREWDIARKHLINLKPTLN